jgi:hypothetical protein
MKNESFVSWSQWEEGLTSFIHSFIHEESIFFLGFSLVPNVFPSCSHGIPKMFPIAPHIYPIRFCPKFNSHVCKVKRWAIWASTFVSILQLEVKRDCFDLGVPNVTKFFDDGPINMTPLTQKNINVKILWLSWHYPCVFYTFILKLVQITFHIAPTCEVNIIIPCRNSQIYLNIILTFDVECFGFIMQNTMI